MTEAIWTLIAFTLTLAILSYALGDNPLFRIASYLFVGVSTGYLAVIFINQVLLPRLIEPLMSDPAGNSLLLIPLVLSVLLLAKLSPRLSFLGSPSMAFLVGVGAAVAISGALFGTLFTQVRAAGLAFTPSQGGISNWAGGLILLLGTITTLAYFQFTGQAHPGRGILRPRWVEVLARTGQVFIAITLGGFFAGVLLTSLTLLIDRLNFIIQFFKTLIP